MVGEGVVGWGVLGKGVVGWGVVGLGVVGDGVVGAGREYVVGVMVGEGGILQRKNVCVNSAEGFTSRISPVTKYRTSECEPKTILEIG